MKLILKVVMKLSRLLIDGLMSVWLWAQEQLLKIEERKLR